MTDLFDDFFYSAGLSLSLLTECRLGQGVGRIRWPGVDPQFSPPDIVGLTVVLVHLWNVGWVKG